MKKVSFLIAAGLTLMICAAVIWQWRTFSDSNISKAESGEEITVAAVVMVDEKGLNIKQVFNNLDSSQEYQASIPVEATGLKCSKGNGNRCVKNMTKTKELRFEYNIPSAQGNSLFLNDWLIVLKNTGVKNTRIEVVDKFYRKGTWVTGVPLKGYKQTELLNYYVFAGFNPSPSLYWQEKPLAKSSGQKGIDYYSSRTDQLIYRFDNLNTLSRDNHLSVIITDDYRPALGNGLLVTGNRHSDKAIEKLAAKAFLSTKLIGDEPDLDVINEVLALLVTRQETDTPKSKAMLEELRNILTEEQLTDFIANFSKEKMIGEEFLDGYLSKIIGLNTSFFKSNSRNEAEFIPMLFTDTRSVLINGVETDGLDVIIKDDQTLFPLTKTMSAIGMVTKAGPELVPLEISSAYKKYSFNIKDKTFTLDGQSYGLLELPFQKLNGEWFLEKYWLEAIFKVRVSEDKDRILLDI
ncbi:hypothetical protein [Mesobacillus jeotgali]|uniref:hypothetical protein n=1 Tax=Mesobacillus jeotgali TaxID=129985 RepID=UPI0009A5B17A|nr:hypothetical protein [Mesobacillus jeotgali]